MNETLIPMEDVPVTPPDAAVPQPVPAPPARPRTSPLSVMALLLSLAAVILSAGALFLSLPRSELPAGDGSGSPASGSAVSTPAPIPTITFNGQQLPVQDVALNEYDLSAFVTSDSGHITYTHPDRTAIPGIDVSEFQGEVDWKQVKASGIEFAMLRVGFRGYGEAGALVPDKHFQQNLTGALDAGLKVGVYFFSQAINTEEAREEAQFVLDAIKGYELDYPVVFDWERITNGQSARTDGLSGRTVTLCARAFCEEIAAAGYTPAVYFNQNLGYLSLELELLDQYPFWLAAYSSRPTFHYHFDMWQYTAKGRVPGIQGSVDLNLSFVDFSAEEP